MHRFTSPKNSEWSVTAAKSSGRSRLVLRVCCSSSSASTMLAPWANAYASRGPTFVPKMYASAE